MPVIPVDALKQVHLCAGDTFKVSVAKDRMMWNYQYVATNAVTILIKIKDVSQSPGDILYAPIRECVIEWLVNGVSVDPRQFEI